MASETSPRRVLRTIKSIPGISSNPLKNLSYKGTKSAFAESNALKEGWTVNANKDFTGLEWNPPKTKPLTNWEKVKNVAKEVPGAAVKVGTAVPNAVAGLVKKLVQRKKAQLGK